MLEFFTPGLGPMLDACGLDFVIFDMEHGRCDVGMLEQMIASCRGSRIVPMVRVPDLNFTPLSRVLDLGVRGVMVISNSIGDVNLLSGTFRYEPIAACVEQLLADAKSYAAFGKANPPPAGVTT